MLLQILYYRTNGTKLLHILMKILMLRLILIKPALVICEFTCVIHASQNTLVTIMQTMQIKLTVGHIMLTGLITGIKLHHLPLKRKRYKSAPLQGHAELTVESGLYN